MYNEKPVTFKNEEGKILFGVIHYSEGMTIRKKQECIIICHGFAKTKSQRKFVELGRVLSQHGFTCLRFDFAGAGDSEGWFAETTIERQISDLAAARKFLADETGILCSHLLGHSLGALVASLYYLVQSDKIKSLILLAPAFDHASLQKDWHTNYELRKWRKQGFIDTDSFRIGVNYLNEAKDYTEIAEKIKCPVMIIHGTEDETVNPKYSKLLFKPLENANPKKLVFIKGADHDLESHKAKQEIKDRCLDFLD